MDGTMHLGDKERLDLWGIRHWFEADALRVLDEFRQAITDLLASSEAENLDRALANIRQLKFIFQRVHNCNHTLARLAAKSFLEAEFPMLPWSEIQFTDEPNARGPDILVRRDGAKIVGAVKTTEPCRRPKSGKAEMKFGANQEKEIRKDLSELSSAKYSGYARYMFVTSPLAFHILTQDYECEFPAVTFVLLKARHEVSRARPGSEK
jgi:hypothetical protein